MPQFVIYKGVLQTGGRNFVLCIRLLPDGNLYLVSLAAKRAVVELCVLGCKTNTGGCYRQAHVPTADVQMSGKGINR